jgi:hypothetical protein
MIQTDKETLQTLSVASIPSDNQRRHDAMEGHTKTGSGKPITELFPIHVAAALRPILRLTELRAACRSALPIQRSALYHAAVVIALFQAVLTEKWAQAIDRVSGYFPFQ